jgi:hypothetical protein
MNLTVALVTLTATSAPASRAVPCPILLSQSYQGRCFDAAREIVLTLHSRNEQEGVEVLFVSNIRRFAVHTIVNSGGWIWDPIVTPIHPIAFRDYFNHYVHGFPHHVRVVPGESYLLWYSEETERLIDVTGRRLDPGFDLFPGLVTGHNFLPFGESIIQSVASRFPIKPLSEYLRDSPAWKPSSQAYVSR